MREEANRCLEVENGLFLAVLAGVEVVQTSENGGLEERAVARLHASVEKDLHAVAKDHLLRHVNHQLQHQLQTGHAQRVCRVVRDAEDGENERPRNGVRVVLPVNSRGYAHHHEMAHEGERMVPLLGEFVAALKTHNHQDVDLVAHHSLRDRLVHAQVPQQAQGCVLSYGE